MEAVVIDKIIETVMCVICSWCDDREKCHLNQVNYTQLNECASKHLMSKKMLPVHLRREWFDE